MQSFFFCLWRIWPHKNSTQKPEQAEDFYWSPADRLKLRLDEIQLSSWWHKVFVVRKSQPCYRPRPKQQEGPAVLLRPSFMSRYDTMRHSCSVRVCQRSHVTTHTSLGTKRYLRSMVTPVSGLLSLFDTCQMSKAWVGESGRRRNIRMMV